MSRVEREIAVANVGARRALACLVAAALGLLACNQDDTQPVVAVEQAAKVVPAARSAFAGLSAPAGTLPTTTSTTLRGRPAAILPNGRFLTPAGVEVGVLAPKPFGLALSPDGKTLATINSGSSQFSVTLIRNLDHPAPDAARVDLNATFMGVVFSSDSKRFYASGGENGNLWVGDATAARIIGSVNLNGAGHPLDRPLAPNQTPTLRFKGAFPGNMTLSHDGRYLYVVDQGAFVTYVVDTTKLVVGTDATGAVTEPDNFAAVISQVKVGRYPFGLALSSDDRTLLVSNVGVFQYSHLRPASPVGNNNVDYPLCIPGTGYPDEVLTDKTIAIKKIDASKVSGLPLTMRDPDGIRCGYIPADIPQYTIPALGSPNATEASAVYVVDVSNPAAPLVRKVLKTGRAVGETEAGIATYGASHPNSIAFGSHHVYVANGNHDSISVLDPHDFTVTGEIPLAALAGADSHVKGVQPVGLALDDHRGLLFVAEAGLNAVGVVDLGGQPHLAGHIPAGWWPAAVRLSSSGRTLYVANAKGRGAGPNIDNLAPKFSVLGTAEIIDLDRELQHLTDDTSLVLRNNGLVGKDQGHDGAANDDGPIPQVAGRASDKIKHVIFINKENATHDLLLGDITTSRRGVVVDGDPTFSLGQAASPNHHELALSFAFGDNFYLEPAVSSDGHRWLTNSYTTELEETHWPASYGGERRDSGDDPEVIAHYPGRIGFTDANSSPTPEDYNQHGTFYLHLVRHGLDFVNFGNGYEFALVDEDRLTEPTGIREHANVPMEKVVRDRTDHLYPEFNTAIPDSPLPEDPDRFNRFGRFKQMFEANYVDRETNKCKLPAYVDLYYPNDHGGGANDIHPGGPAWDFTRFVQDNDAAVGLTAELISKSPCWKDTVIFVVEDDTQNGLDHRDGYRSLFLAVSPWVKREHVAKEHLSLASIFKTVDLILGLPPLNQYDAAATDLRGLFTDHPDFTPYDYRVPAFLAMAKPSWKKLTRGIDFRHRDGDEVRLRLAIARSEHLPLRLPPPSRHHRRRG